METHLEHLRSLFVKLREADLKLKEVKCNFLKKHIQYLEVEIDTGDNLPITQKPYTLPLKHTTWVQTELGNFGESWCDSEKCLTLG